MRDLDTYNLFLISMLIKCHVLLLTFLLRGCRFTNSFRSIMAIGRPFLADSCRFSGNKTGKFYRKLPLY